MSKKDIVTKGDFVLPSKGLIYAETFDPHVSLSSMTTTHEMKRLSHSEYPYLNLCEIIDDCLITELPISSYDMCVGDFQYLLYMLRVVTYGGAYNLMSRCPFCGCENEHIVDIASMEKLEYSDELLKYKEFDLPALNKRVKIKHQTPRIMDMVAEKAKEHKKRTKGKQPDATMVFEIMSVLESVNGKMIDSIALEDWVRELPMKDANLILYNSTMLSKSIGVDVILSNTCSVCGLDYKTPFRTTQEFFRPTIFE